MKITNNSKVGLVGVNISLNIKEMILLQMTKNAMVSTSGAINDEGKVSVPVECLNDIFAFIDKITEPIAYEEKTRESLYGKTLVKGNTSLEEFTCNHDSVEEEEKDSPDLSSIFFHGLTYLQVINKCRLVIEKRMKVKYTDLQIYHIEVKPNEHNVLAVRYNYIDCHENKILDMSFVTKGQLKNI